MKTSAVNEPKAEIDPRLIVKDVQNYFGSSVVRFDEIKAGACNRLFRFDLDNRDPVLVKFYYADERNRLSREFSALTFLQSNGFSSVPKPFYEDSAKGYATYSFEPGQPKQAEALTRADLLQMIDFLVNLHAYQPEEVSTHFSDAIFACFTLQDYIKNIEYRCGQFSAALDSNGLSPRISRFAIGQDLLKRVRSLTQQATKGLTEKELKRPIGRDQRRLSTVDFGPHNTLFDTDGIARFVDLEYFGWDDPLRDIAGFVEHDQLRALPIEEKRFVIDYYHTHVNLPSAFLDRLPVILQLVAVEWICIHMLALTPMKINIRKFSNPQFDQASYEEDQLSKMKSRLDDFGSELN